MITLKEFKNEKIAINTKTQEEYDSLMRFFDSKGIEWFDGMIATEKEAFSPDMTDITKHYVIYDCGLNMYNDFICKDMKIITPNELKEYNEFMGKAKLNNLVIDHRTTTQKLKDLDTLSSGKYFENQYLTIGQAIDYMLESEDNVVEYYDTNESETLYRSRIIDKRLVYTKDTFKKWYYDDNRVFNWTKIRKYIEEPKKTLKELIENKEPFEYKNKQYRFNKKGVLMDKNANPLSLEEIKNLLKKGEENE